MYLITLAAALSPQSATPTRAIALFQSVCLGGEAELKPSELVKVGPKGLPASARSLLKFISAGEQSSERVSIAPNRLPEIAYRVSAEEETYLIVPDAGATSGYRSTCAVYVNADHYFEGMKAVARIVYGTDANITKPVNGEVSFGGGVSGYVVTAAREHGSTLLAAVKNPDYPNLGNAKE